MQLGLNLFLRDGATFANFCSKGNDLATENIQQVVKNNSETSVFLWGRCGVGRSHLLQAACNLANDLHKSSVYLPLKDLQDHPPKILDDLEGMQVICLDDLHVVAGCKDWEEAIFHLYNRVKDVGGSLLVTSDASVRNTKIMLPDLQSRMAWGVVYHLHNLDDHAKSEVLMSRAKSRGINLNRASATFLLRHKSRDMQELLQLLKLLDQKSMALQRKITIPFIKSVL